jgi:hypothetical protein
MIPNEQKGQKVRTLDALWAAAMKSRCVIGDHTWFTKPRPAAFVISMQANRVRTILRQGIYLYKPARKLRREMTA